MNEANGKLPAFLWYRIFSYLATKEQNTALTVCKNWRDVIQQKKALDSRTSQMAMNDIPSDVWKIIFSLLDLKSKFNFGKTCKFWQPIANDKTIWLEECKKNKLATDPKEILRQKLVKEEKQEAKKEARRRASSPCRH